MLITPGDHVHAPQYTFRGIAMDLELLDWLNTYTFPEESNYYEGLKSLLGGATPVDDLRHLLNYPVKMQRHTCYEFLMG